MEAVILREELPIDGRWQKLKLEVRLLAKELPRHPGVTVRKVLFMEDCEPDNSAPWELAPPERHVSRPSLTERESKPLRYEIATLRPAARHVRQTWEERGQFCCEVPFKPELVEYLKVIQVLFSLADLHQAATVLAVHRIGRVNEFLDTCQFTQSWRPVFHGYGFEAEYSDENAWQLLYAVAGEASSFIRWLESSRHQDQWQDRSEAVRHFAGFVRNDVVPFARLGVFRGKSGGVFFNDVSEAMLKRISAGPLGKS